MANQIFRGSNTIVRVFRAKFCKKKITRFFSTKEVVLDLEKFWDIDTFLRKNFYFFLSIFDLVRVANQVFRGSYTSVMVFRAKFWKKKFFRFFSTKEVALDLEKFLMNFFFFFSKFGLVSMANEVFRGSYTILMVFRAKFCKKKFFHFSVQKRSSWT